MAAFPGSITIDAAKHVRQMTLRVHVRGATRTLWRTQLARYWLQIGAWIIGSQFALDSEEDK